MAIHKAVFKFEMIYDDEDFGGSADCLSLTDIDYHTTDGHASGRFLDTEDTELTPKEAYKALEEQGSDPTFLNLFKCEREGCEEVVVASEDDEVVLCPKCAR